MTVQKPKPAHYTVEFTTALSPDQCRARLAGEDAPHYRGPGSSLAPMLQHTFVAEDGAFTIERTYPGALYALRFQGHLDSDTERGGTWVHGAITHDSENQILIEGMIVFLTFFLLMALMYLRLRARSVVFALPLILLILTVFSLRWRALRESTLDMALWVRRKLYVTAEQIRRN